MFSTAASPMAAGAQPVPVNHRSLRCIVLAILGFVIVIGLIALIVWLAVRPTKIKYTIENAQVHNYNLSSSNALNATFDISLRAYSRNRRVSVYYDWIEVSVWYRDQMLASSDTSPSYHMRRNATVQARLGARSVPLAGDVAGRLRRERTMGRAGFDVRVKARIRFKVGLVKSRHYRLKVDCPQVVVIFPPSMKAFERVYCHAHV